eukprot:1499267-Lingulodinium_polyedra.AAC.1
MIEPPPGGFPGLEPGQLCEAVTEAYGLVSGPFWWRTTLITWLKQHGYRQNPYDACVFVLDGPDGDSVTMTEG